MDQIPFEFSFTYLQVSKNIFLAEKENQIIFNRSRILSQKSPTSDYYPVAKPPLKNSADLLKKDGEKKSNRNLFPLIRRKSKGN